MLLTFPRLLLSPMPNKKAQIIEGAIKQLKNDKWLQDLAHALENHIKQEIRNTTETVDPDTVERRQYRSGSRGGNQALNDTGRLVEGLHVVVRNNTIQIEAPSDRLNQTEVARRVNQYLRDSIALLRGDTSELDKISQEVVRQLLKRAK